MTASNSIPAPSMPPFKLVVTPPPPAATWTMEIEDGRHGDLETVEVVPDVAARGVSPDEEVELRKLDGAGPESTIPQADGLLPVRKRKPREPSFVSACLASRRSTNADWSLSPSNPRAPVQINARHQRKLVFAGICVSLVLFVVLAIVAGVRKTG
ncbi:hypothetical protein HDU96_002391 [Phlyctochytrium bullatum]|nr:hypothetical protein HDU96_002391 [Phlyctochytrium bullatum]